MAKENELLELYKILEKGYKELLIQKEKLTEEIVDEKAQITGQNADTAFREAAS